MLTIARTRGEGHEHPTLDDPLVDVFVHADAWSMRPEEVMAMDSEMFMLRSAWTFGKSRGERARRGG